MHEQRTQVVLGDGIACDNMIIGEAPGKDEELSGIPFYGKAGKILDEYLEEAELRRSMFYVSNTCCCRPPGNRKPKSKEILACFRRLKFEINIVRPKRIVLAGATAQKLLEFKETKDFFKKFAIFKVLHPAALIYDGKREEQFRKQLNKLAYEITEIPF